MKNFVLADRFPTGFVVGDRIKYMDIGLPNLGTITAIRKTQHGGDCLVQWDKYQFVSEECTFNLMRI